MKWWENLLGETIFGVLLSLATMFCGWLKGDAVPFWATFLCFIIGGLSWRLFAVKTHD